MNSLTGIPTKFLFDGLTKNTLTLAKCCDYLCPDDQFSVYDVDRCPIDNFDVKYLTEVEKDDDGNIFFKDFDPDSVSIINGKPVANEQQKNGHITAVTDFDEALEMCDVYVNLESAEHIYAYAGNTEEAQQKIDAMLSRVQKVIEKGKPIYLGHMYDSEFETVVRNYEQSLNHVINQIDLEEVKQYRGDLFAETQKKTKITLLIGTTAGSGKFTSALKLKKQYEDQGLRAVILMTEETYPFLDNFYGDIYGFCRNFSDLTTEEEFLYLQCLIGKIIEEKVPDRIIVVSQGAYGFMGTSADYINERVKMKGITAMLIEQAIGADAVVVATSWDKIITAQSYLEYFTLLGVPVEKIYVSPINTGNDGTLDGVDVELHCGAKVIVSDIGTRINVAAWSCGLAAKYPYTQIICDHMGITEEIEAFRKTDCFIQTYAQTYINQILAPLINAKRASEEQQDIDGAISAAAENTETSCEFSEAVLELIKKYSLKYDL